MNLFHLFSCVLYVLCTTYSGQGENLRSWIVGGREARPNSWPFIASLQIQGQHFCGGSLIAPQFLLTAAHCFQDLNPVFVTVVLGVHSLTANEATRQRFRISRIFENGFNPQSLENDILVLMLDRAADLNASVQTVKLPEQNQTVPSGALCVTAGWGQLSTQGRAPDRLQELNVTVTRRNRCRPTNICTRVFMRQAGICFGDSGGPLVCDGVLQGVSSFIIDTCGNGIAPDFFARVALFRSFIDSALASVERKRLRHPDIL
ncbi:myeloblastin-like [Rhinatrema bivittatum]|uniref:myeloblastin-like n=1 Tax=Rhinatrema bivittatum TaxID=194408 RepID=UPI001127050E|nr:myeloblastin-like [Rhinatrema bivittatum]